jgi:hypothetical protein
MADRLRKFRKDNYVEKRFGKDINVSTKEDAPLRKEMTAAETKSVSKAQPSSGASPLSFSAAFAAARKDGDKTFTWKGKSFTTQLASEKKSPSAPVRRTPATETKKAAAPAAPASAPKKVEKSGAPAAGAAKTNAPVTRETAFAQLQDKNKTASPSATKPKEAPKSGVQQRGEYASRLTQSAAAKRKLEGAPTEVSGSSFARLKNAIGFGSSADERLAQTLRRSAANQAQNEARMNKAKAEREAAAAERIRVGKEKAKAGNPFYQSYANKAKGGSVKGYAKGGRIDGIAVRGKTKAGRK